jgi:homoisocitrate dehydrogenase
MSRAWNVGPLDKVLIISIQYVKQETSSETENGKEARATRLITERASRRIGQMAFELAAARPRKLVTIIHKSNVLSVTDGLFRETVRAVGSQSKYQDVKIQEQLVDSAVYRYVNLLKDV